MLAEDAEGTMTSAAILFSRFLFTGGPWLVPLCIRAERTCCCFLDEALCSFLLAEPFFPLVLDAPLSGDILFSKLTLSCSILFAIDDLSLYTILGVSWFGSAALSLEAPGPFPFVWRYRPKDLSFWKSGWNSSSRIC